MPRNGERPPCSIAGCEKPHKGHGYCGTHYQRFRKYGDPLFVHFHQFPPGVSAKDRVETIGWTVNSDGCYEWNGHVAKDGYGIVCVDGGGRGQAHRVYYEALNGELQPNELVCHTCDNRKCVNTEHHFIGGHLENNRDRAAKGRSSRGEGHYAHRLTWQQVEEIRRRYVPGQVSQQALADEYGVSQQVISGIVRYKGWVPT